MTLQIGPNKIDESQLIRRVIHIEQKLTFVFYIQICNMAKPCRHALLEKMFSRAVHLDALFNEKVNTG